jgi:hypothetical protein
MLVDKIVFTLMEAVAQTAEWLGVTIVEPEDEVPEEQEQRGALLQTISGIASS